jgi:hypothetical protein
VTVALPLIHILCSSLQHILSLLSLLYLHQSLPCIGFQRRKFPLLWVSELPPCLSYQLLTAKVYNHRTALHSLTKLKSVESYSLIADQIENTTFNITFLVALGLLPTDDCSLGLFRGRCLETGLYATIS